MIVKIVTKKIGKYLRESKVNLSKLSRDTGIPYNLLYASAWDKKRVRELRVDEFLSICVVLAVNPMEFYSNMQHQNKLGLIESKR